MVFRIVTFTCESLALHFSLLEKSNGALIVTSAGSPGELLLCEDNSKPRCGFGDGPKPLLLLLLIAMMNGPAPSCFIAFSRGTELLQF